MTMLSTDDRDTAEARHDVLRTYRILRQVGHADRTDAIRSIRNETANVVAILLGRDDLAAARYTLLRWQYADRLFSADLRRRERFALRRAAVRDAS